MHYYYILSNEQQHKFNISIEHLLYISKTLSNEDLELKRPLPIKLKNEDYERLDPDAIGLMNKFSRCFNKFVFSKAETNHIEYMVNFFKTYSHKLNVKFKNIFFRFNKKQCIDIFKSLLSSNLISLNLSNCRINDDLMHAFYNSLVNLKGSLLRKINFSQNSITSKGFQFVLALIQEGKLKELRSVDFSFNRLKENTFNKLEGIKDLLLEKVDFSNNDLTDNDVYSLCSFLKKEGLKIRKLNLLGNHYDSKGYYELLQFISSSKALKSISIVIPFLKSDKGLKLKEISFMNIEKLFLDFKIKDKECSYITYINELAILIKEAKNLRYLSLKLWKIDTIETIFLSLKNNTHLIDFNLSFTYFNGIKEVLILASNVYTTNIMRLTVNSCYLSNEKAMILFLYLKNSTRLKALELRNNQLSNHIIPGVNDLIYESKINYVDLSYNELDNSFGRSILTSLLDSRRKVKIILHKNYIDNDIIVEINKLIVSIERS